VEGASAVFILRGMMSPFAHPLFTSMTGIGLGWAAQSNRWSVKLFAPWLGLALAMSLHAMWNLSATIHVQLWLVTYLFLMAPCGLGVGLILLLALKREGELLRHHLRGDLAPEQLRAVSSVWRRVAFSLGKLFRKGPSGWLAAESFLQVASELAFWRNRQQRGFVSDPAEEGELLAQLHRLQSKLT
jgi:hypothetical protein